MTQLGFIVPFLDLGSLIPIPQKTDSLFLAGFEYGKRWSCTRVLPAPIETWCMFRGYYGYGIFKR